MLFKFKKKKIVVDAFTHDLVAFEAFKVKKSIEFIPDWFKLVKKPSITDLARGCHSARTIKMCPGFAGLFSKGFIIPLWSDVFLQLSAYDGRPESGEMKFCFSDNDSRISFHHPEQFEGFLAPYGLQQMKFEVPWVFKTSAKTNFIMMGCNWNYPKGMPFTVLPGIIDLKLNTWCHVNAYVRYKNEPQEILIPCGSPLAQVIPLSEDDLEIKTHMVSPDEFSKLNQKSPSWCSFSNGYRKALKRME